MSCAPNEVERIESDRSTIRRSYYASIVGKPSVGLTSCTRSQRDWFLGVVEVCYTDERESGKTGSVEVTASNLRYTRKMGPSTNELSALKAQVDSLRPLTDLQIQRLWPQWVSEDALFVYATNAIEGSTMTLAETTVVLESGITIGGKTVQEHLDIVNGQRAYKLMLELARAQTSIDAEAIFSLHRAVVGEQEWAGKWRTEPVKVARLMDEALERFAVSVRIEHPVVAASTLHFDLLTVHPFQDDNGRTARLVQNLHRIATGYAPVLIDPTEKANYLSVVQQAQIAVPGAGDRTDFVAYMIGLEYRALERYMRSLRIAYGPEHAQSESTGSFEEQRQES